MQITNENSVCLKIPSTFPTLFLSSLDLFIGQESSSTCSRRAADGESGRETGQKPLQIVGETGSAEPVTGVTGCDGLHVTGDDGL